MASGFVTSAGKQWAGQYDCGNSRDYGKSAGRRTKGEEKESAAEARRETPADERKEGEA